jgi:hypothetical protein
VVKVTLAILIFEIKGWEEELSLASYAESQQEQLQQEQPEEPEQTTEPEQPPKPPKCREQGDQPTRGGGNGKEEKASLGGEKEGLCISSGGGAASKRGAVSGE